MAERITKENDGDEAALKELIAQSLDPMRRANEVLP